MEMWFGLVYITYKLSTNIPEIIYQTLCMKLAATSASATQVYTLKAKIHLHHRENAKLDTKTMKWNIWDCQSMCWQKYLRGGVCGTHADFLCNSTRIV